jgi:ParB-like nuclease domain
LSQQTSQQPSAPGLGLEFPSLAIDQITIDYSVQIRQALSEEAIARYEQVLDRLPPIAVFRLREDPSVLLLSDGFHRLAAHSRQGRSEIRAEILEGSRDEAMEYAVIANVRHGMPLLAGDRAAGIKRLFGFHPDWSPEVISGRMDCGEQTVRNVINAGKVRSGLAHWKPISRFTDTDLALVAPLLGEQGEPERVHKLLQAADKLSLTQDGLRTAVQNLLDPKIPDDHKQKLLSGEVAPAVKTEDGEYRTPISLVKKGARVPDFEPDPVGDDVAERLKAVRFKLEVSYQLPSSKTRVRGMKTYSRESENVTRHWTLNLGPEALEYSSMQVAQAVGKFLVRTLAYEGWPAQENFSTPPRPGLPGA